MGVNIAHHAKQHIIRPVKCPMAGIQHFRGDLPYGFLASQDGGADGMIGVHIFHQQLKDPVIRVIPAHADLLADDPLLFFHAFFCKIGGGNKLQKQPQAAFELVGAGEIISGHIVAGKGVGISAQSCEFLAHIPSRQVEHLMLQKMGNAGGDGEFFSIDGKFCVNRAEIRDEISQLFGKARPGYDADRQAGIADLPVHRFVPSGVIHFLHHAPPFRKKLLWQRRVFATRAQSSTVTARTWSMYCSGVQLWPLRAPLS